jgi:hypothetical protein
MLQTRRIIKHKRLSFQMRKLSKLIHHLLQKPKRLKRNQLQKINLNKTRKSSLRKKTPSLNKKPKMIHKRHPKIRRNKSRNSNRAQSKFKQKRK